MRFPPPRFLTRGKWVGVSNAVKAILFEINVLLKTNNRKTPCRETSWREFMTIKNIPVPVLTKKRPANKGADLFIEI